MDNSSTRINGKFMNKYAGRMVTLICTYIGKNERGQAVVRTSDGIDIVAVLPPGESFESQIAQIEGKIATPTVIEAFKVVAVSDGFDFSNYDQAVDMMNGRFESLFVAQ